MPNRLADATSPYLQQHKDNPVQWLEWGEEAFRLAREQDKPVMLSVGYAACHWCHVMAHESFEDAVIAKQINDGFIAIKVDREERPDIDQVYQQAIQLLGVGGGWPLTAFLLPDGRPFYGGTYFPPSDMYGRPGLPTVLSGVRDAWEKRRNEVDENATQLMEAVKEADALPPESGQIVGDVSASAANWLLRRVDPENGGFGERPKFPNAMAIEVLLRASLRFKQQGPRDASLFSLGKMAEGGIYDQVGGGFHRYSTDERWHVPHFEKMLYDNALLAKSYANAWRATGEPWTAHVASEVLAYLAREMRSPEGAFYASSDADSAPPSDPKQHPEEGEFFAWTEQEIVEVLGAEDAKIWNLRYGVTGGDGNWEGGKNVLILSARDEDVAQETGKTVEQVQASLIASRPKLYAAREKRPRPFRDEKILTSWNGLAISAFAVAGAAFGRRDLVDAGATAARAILDRAWDGTRERLLRAPAPAGKAPIAPFGLDGAAPRAPLLGTLDDYANLTEALLDLWEATLEANWLDRAESLAADALRLFAGPDGELYLVGNDGEALVHRPLSLHDQSLPAGSGVITHAWLRLARLTGRDDFEKAARKTLDRHRHSLQTQPFGFGAMLAAWDTAEHPTDIVIAGPLATPEAEAMLALIRKSWLPGAAMHLAPVLVGGRARSPIANGKTPVGGKTTVYVCRDRTCSLPVTTPDELAKLLS